MDQETKPAQTDAKVRPTKKQQEMLMFIEDFINVRGYSPSYREIMQGLKYNSVATVALHIRNLIARGHLQKRDRSARSLEVVQSTQSTEATKVVPKQLKTSEAKWLVSKVEQFFKEVEGTSHYAEKEIDQLYVLIGALKVLGMESASSSFMPRLNRIKKKKSDGQYVV